MRNTADLKGYNVSQQSASPHKETPEGICQSMVIISLNTSILAHAVIISKGNINQFIRDLQDVHLNLLLIKPHIYKPNRVKPARKWNRDKRVSKVGLRL